MNIFTKIFIVGLAMAALFEYATKPEPTQQEKAQQYAMCKKYWLWHPAEWRLSCSDTGLVYGGKK